MSTVEVADGTAVFSGDAGSPEPSAARERVGVLELFFDLVFVFAITQVTALMSQDPTWRGLGHGLLVLGALWWAWVAYAWLTNEVDPEEGGVRVVMFGVMAAILIAALATPRAFAGDGLVFGCAYLVVRILQLVLYRAGSDDPGVRRAVRRLAPSSLIAGALLIGAGTQGGGVRVGLWCVALAIDFMGPLITGVAGWRVSPGHFAERHGLIIIIALGESIVALGAAAGHSLSFGVVAAGVCGIAVAGAMWWVYFDVAVIVAERKLRSLEGEAQNRVARDSYSYLHLPMVAGIVLVALAIKKTIAHVGEPLDVVPAVALGGGVALYLTGHALFRLRNMHSWSGRRVALVVTMLAIIPLLHRVDAAVAMAMVAVVLIAAVGYEAVHLRELRQRIRHGD